MTPTPVRDPAATDRTGHLGAWRALAALPAMLASAAVMLVLFGWAGHWVGLVLLGWLGCGLLALTRRGERIVVWLACGFRRPTRTEQAVLASAWTDLLSDCRIPANSVDLYVQRSAAINAYATGSRSVAVTTRVVRERRAGHLNEQALIGLLAHELGHTVTAAVRYAPATAWLALPWRAGSRLVLRLASRLAGPQPKTALAAVAGLAVVVGIGQAARQHAWAPAAVLIALAVFGTVTPIADAALSRAAERSADRYAEQTGHGQDLAQALSALATTDRHLPRRNTLLDTHPELRTRIDDLKGNASGRTLPGTRHLAAA